MHQQLIGAYQPCQKTLARSKCLSRLSAGTPGLADRGFLNLGVAGTRPIAVAGSGAAL